MQHVWRSLAVGQLLFKMLGGVVQPPWRGLLAASLSAGAALRRIGLATK